MDLCPPGEDRDLYAISFWRGQGPIPGEDKDLSLARTGTYEDWDLSLVRKGPILAENWDLHPSGEDWNLYPPGEDRGQYPPGEDRDLYLVRTGT
jgi:hypothetical protein